MFLKPRHARRRCGLPQLLQVYQPIKKNKKILKKVLTMLLINDIIVLRKEEKTMKEFKLNLKEIKEIRKALALATQNIDCIEEEEKYEEISKLYDLFEQAEEELEEEE